MCQRSLTAGLLGFAFLVALGAFGVALLRRLWRWLSGIEQVAYGAPLGVVVASLALLAVASISRSLSSLPVAATGVAAVAAALLLARGSGVPELSPIGRGSRIAALVIGAFTVRWAVLWWNGFACDEAGALWAGFVNVWGDWAFHHGDVVSLTAGANLPPTHPRLVGEPWAYHYLPAFTAAAMVRTGLSPAAALSLQTFTFSVLIALGCYGFARRLTGGDRPAAALALVLFLLGGGLEWWLVASGSVSSPDPIATLAGRLWDPAANTDANIEWENLYFALIATQRGFLYGLPLTLLVLTLLHRGVRSRDARLFLAAGAVAGLLPLAHLSSLLALALITPALVALFPSRHWLSFYTVWIALAAPQLYLQQGGQVGQVSRARFHLGWMADPDPWLWFWFKNLGLFLPLLGAAYWRRDLLPALDRRFLLSLMTVFVLANVAIFQPWDWDNMKLLTYWFLGVSVLLGGWIAACWRRRRQWLARTGLVLVVLTMTLSGMLLNLHQLLGRDRHVLLTAEEMEVAQRIRQSTPVGAVFATGLQHNHPVLVAGGRRVVLYYGGWLWTFEPYHERRADLEAIYQLSPGLNERLGAYRVDYVVIGPWEREHFAPDLPGFRARFPALFRTANYEVFITGNRAAGG